MIENQDKRAQVSARLWEIARQHITAEWVCCEPLDARHPLCYRGYAALGMVQTLFVDSEPGVAWNPAAPVLDAVMGMLEGDAEEPSPPTVKVPLETFRHLVKIAMWVSRGRSFAYTPDPNISAAYPDAMARFTLGALHDAGLLPLVGEEGDGD